VYGRVMRRIGVAPWRGGVGMAATIDRSADCALAVR
jgi:hypothetical protein